MGRVLGGLAAVPVSLLGERWRRPVRALPLRFGTIVSGALEVLVFGWALARLLAAHHERLARAMHAALGELERVNVEVRIPLAGAGTLELLLSPAGLLLGFGFVEGLARMLSALHLRRPCGTAAAALLERVVLKLHHATSALVDRVRVGRALPDDVSRDAATGSVSIASNRRRPWNPTVGIEYEDRIYRIARCERRQDSHPFVYVLEECSPDEVFAEIQRYP